MAYGIVHNFPGGTKEQYEASIAAVHPSDGSLPEGQLFHAAGPPYACPEFARIINFGFGEQFLKGINLAIVRINSYPQLRRRGDAGHIRAQIGG